MTAHLARAVFDGTVLHEGAALLVEDGRVAGIVPADEAAGERVDHGAAILAPGFVDLQVNGGGGAMFNGAPTVATLATIAEAHARLGTTALLPTLVTDTPEVTGAAIEAAVLAVEQGVPGIAGLHLEGPHLSVAKKGAHRADYVRPMAHADLAQLIEAARRLPVLKVTVAAETVTPAQVSALATAGAVVSIGHSDADFDTASAAFEAGARCVTHLFNAMSQMGSRTPGVAGAALDNGTVWGGIIADGLHVHPAVLATAIRGKRGPGRLYLVTDAMAPAGTDDAGFDLNGRWITRADGRLTLEDGTLAGADLALADAVALVVSLGVPVAEALAMATSIPAEAVGQGAKLGHLSPGRTADFVALSPDWAVDSVWRGGARLSA